ncbi:MAG: DUF4388 domain-containing protein [Thermoleophilia bacterium]
MILQGNISYFSVFMVLQLLASYGKSGVLELEDDEEKALIYIIDGYVEAVSVPRSDHLLGARLVKGGFLSPADLRRVLLSAALQDKREYLGITLMKSGLIDETAMMRVLEEQTYENTLELSNWVKGSFKFVVPSRQVVFPVSPHINVQHLLLETSRRLDEGQRPTKEKEVLPGEELCVSCNAGCDQHDKMKYLKDGICLWRNMPVVVREAVFTYDAEGKGFSDEEEDVRDLPFL